MSENRCVMCNEVIQEVERTDVDIITTNNLDYFMSNII